MQYRHTHVSPTMDLMAKKIFSLPAVTAKFIREMLDLPVESVEILEGDQIHAQRNREKGQTHHMYREMEPVYGIAILERTLLEDESAPINVYEMRHIEHNGPLLSTYKGGKRQNLLRLAFLELDKYNKSKEREVNSEQRQWLEFFGNVPFSQEPDQVIQVADSLLDASSWTKEEKAMIDEQTRIRENWAMSMETLREESIAEGLAKGRAEGHAEGHAEGRVEGEKATKIKVAKELMRKGMDLSFIQEVTDLDLSTLKTLVSEQSLG